MPGPLTGFEQSGQWTTLAQELSLLNQIDSETSATVSIIGKSGLGRDMRAVSIGTPNRGTMFIVAEQHGTEQASRDGCLTHIRDMAYSTDPAVIAYLSNHRIVYVPTANPDGFANGTRLTGEGGNLNRDWFMMEWVETRNIMKHIQATEPSVIIDMHELISSSSNSWYARGNGLPSTHANIQSLGNSLQNSAISGMNSSDIVSVVFPGSEYPRAGLSTAAGAYHAVGLLGESNITGHTFTERVNIQRVSLDHVIEWHTGNAVSAQTARGASIARDLTSAGFDKMMLKDNFFPSGYEVESVAILGYRLSSGLPDRYADMFNFTVNNGIVPMRQFYRQVIPNLMDPLAIERVITATRIPWPTPPLPEIPMPDGQLSSIYVRIDDRIRPVVGIYQQLGGVLNKITMPN